MVSPITMPRTIAKVEIPETINDKPECIIVGGARCSGKTSRINLLFKLGAIKEEETIVVSYNKILDDYILENYGITNMSESFYKGMRERHKIDELFNESLIEAQKKGKNIIVDSIAGTIKWRKDIVDLISKDYEINLFYVISSHRKQIERNIIKGRAGGRRYNKKTINGFKHLEQYPVLGENNRIKNMQIIFNEADIPLLEGTLD